jgi:hypothetical protein
MNSALLYDNSQRQRLLIAVLVGLCSGLLCSLVRTSFQDVFVDMGWAFNAARDLIAGRDPYRHAASAVLIPYPLTAALVVMPFALMPDQLAIIGCYACICGCLAYGLTRQGQYWRLLVFVSPAFWMAARAMQWSPLFMAVLLYPSLFFTLVAKPTLALPVALSVRWTWKRMLGAALIVVASLLIMPSWPWRWLSQIDRYAGFTPLLAFFGPVLILTLFFWRDWHARFLFFLSITPQHYMFYDQLLVWMIPQTARQMGFLTVTAWIAYFCINEDYTTNWPTVPLIMLGVYLPALSVVLWQQRATLRSKLRVSALIKGFAHPVNKARHE